MPISPAQKERLIEKAKTTPRKKADYWWRADLNPVRGQRVGRLRCPCCSAVEDLDSTFLRFTCPCEWQSCHACYSCISHCQCDTPIRPAWADKAARR